MFAHAGAVAGSLAGLLTNGLDMAKLRLQVQSGAAHTSAQAMFHSQQIPTGDVVICMWVIHLIVTYCGCSWQCCVYIRMLFCLYVLIEWLFLQVWQVKRW